MYRCIKVHWFHSQCSLLNKRASHSINVIVTTGGVYEGQSHNQCRLVTAYWNNPDDRETQSFVANKLIKPIIASLHISTYD